VFNLTASAAGVFNLFMANSPMSQDCITWDHVIPS